MLARMKRRYENTVSALPTLALRPASALRSVFAGGYGTADLRADILAGITVGIVAVPLSMALAIASGVPPQYGLYTAIIAGFVTSLLGGSRTQVSGPTAAFVVILAPIASQYGIGGLLVATVMAGVVLVGLGVARMGQLITYIPHPVTTGFTAGIAVVIATLQIRDFFGLSIAKMPEHFVEKVWAISIALPDARWQDGLVGAITLGILLGWPRITHRIPAPLAALGIISGAVYACNLDVATIGSRFTWTGGTGIPPLPPTPLLPWHLPGPGGSPLPLTFATVKELFPSAFAIAMLGAIESLLSAVVADGMAGTRHDPDAELVAQGTSNILAPFFGGFASTGAIARTATNIRAGARSPIAAAVHAIFVLLAMLLFASFLGRLPMAALAALLLLVAWNMAELKHFARILRVAPKSDVTVLLTCFTLTVMFDMVIAVTVGMILAAFLFMRRMAEISGATLSEGRHPALRGPLPKGVVLYEIAGPLFFGAAAKAMSSLETVQGNARVLILEMSAVPAMDATGLVGLETALERLARVRTFVILTGVQAQPARVLARAGIADGAQLVFAATLPAAVALSRARGL